MRGEKMVGILFCSAPSGSPPHARGKEEIAAGQRHLQGITPACAGKSPKCQSGRRSRWDHPRMRGEKDIYDPAEWDIWGSPPHARGKATEPTDLRTASRITPACAGKSGCAQGSVRGQRDHPRMRGEKPYHADGELCRMGSPPHARGKDVRKILQRADIGITPACAGKRINQFISHFYIKDHPRMRGEKCRIMAMRTESWGSPPHARGKEYGEKIPYGELGITPACAGKSLM